jgi:hypothetical protein
MRKECVMRKLGIVLLTPLALALPSAAFAWGDSCKVKAPRQATVDAAGASSVRVEAKAGSLKIMGEEGLAEVQAQGTACAKNEKALEKVQLRAERSGSEVRVVVDIPVGWNQGGALDLEVRVPAGLAVEVEDGSGEIEIDAVASLKLKDGSGEIEVTGVKGDVSVHDGSGEIKLVDVGGDVRVHDGSGEIEIQGAKGSVIVEDGSGEIEIVDVTGNVTIENDGSGGIVVRGVGQDVRVGRDGSGSIRVQDVGGDFTVEKDGSGGIDHSGVQGEVNIPKK